MRQRHTTVRTEPVITCCEPDDHVPTRLEGVDCATTWMDARVRRARELANMGEWRVLMKGKAGWFFALAVQWKRSGLAVFGDMRARWGREGEEVE